MAWLGLGGLQEGGGDGFAELPRDPRLEGVGVNSVLSREAAQLRRGPGIQGGDELVTPFHWHQHGIGFRGQLELHLCSSEPKLKGEKKKPQTKNTARSPGRAGQIHHCNKCCWSGANLEQPCWVHWSPPRCSPAKCRLHPAGLGSAPPAQLGAPPAHLRGESSLKAFAKTATPAVGPCVAPPSPLLPIPSSTSGSSATHRCEKHSRKGLQEPPAPTPPCAS